MVKGKEYLHFFWELADKSIQDAYLHGLIRVKKVIRRRPRKSTPKNERSASFVYVVSQDNINITVHVIMMFKVLIKVHLFRCQSRPLHVCVHTCSSKVHP